MTKKNQLEKLELEFEGLSRTSPIKWGYAETCPAPKKWIVGHPDARGV
jgi:hypothetical protein